MPEPDPHHQLTPGPRSEPGNGEDSAGPQGHVKLFWLEPIAFWKYRAAPRKRRRGHPHLSGRRHLELAQLAALGRARRTRKLERRRLEIGAPLDLLDLSRRARHRDGLTHPRAALAAFLVRRHELEQVVAHWELLLTEPRDLPTV